jgi:cytidylate kinase
MIITIDGPAGAGKSTVASALARRLDFDFLDTGATYRAVTWKALKDNVAMEDPLAIARVAREAVIEFRDGPAGRRVFCDGEDVTKQIRTPCVTSAVRYVADEPEARGALIALQRRFAEGKDVVTEGRDQGTEVFPDADVKFYLDASIEARAMRRFNDIIAMGESQSIEQVRSEVKERDRVDMGRAVGALRRSDDMILVDSTDLEVEEVVDVMVSFIRRNEDEHGE